MQNVFVKPSPNPVGGVYLVRDPSSLKALAATGEWKPKNVYWTRRIRDKDVIESTPPTAVASAPLPAPAPAPPSPAPAPFTECAGCPEPTVCRQRAACAKGHAA